MENQELVFQSRQVATNLLINHGRRLREHEVTVLNNFLQLSFKVSSWSNITERQCTKIFSVAQKFHRRMTKRRNRINT
jgi:hypothetical protein